MDNWLKEYQKKWKTISVDNIDERLSNLQEAVKKDQKKNRRSTIFMSIAFIAAIGVILWVAISNEFSSLISWATIIGTIVLMVLTAFLRVKTFMEAPDPQTSEIEYINKLIDSYSLRLKMQQQFLWIYVVILNLLLIAYYFDSYYPQELNVLAWATLGTIGYSILVMLLMNKKRKNEIEFVSGVIEELKSMRSDLSE